MKLRLKNLFQTLIGLSVLLSPSLLTATASADPVITQNYITTGYSNSNSPRQIINGPDGATWFSNYGGSSIGRLSATGAFTGYPVAGNPQDVVTGPNGNLWIAVNSEIEEMQPNGDILNEYPLPGQQMWWGTLNAIPYRMVVGSDGAIWFTDHQFSNRIGKITTDGTLSYYSLPGGVTAGDGIELGPDGNLWVSASNSGATALVKIDPQGQFDVHNLPTGVTVSNFTAGPDGNLWATGYLNGTSNPEVYKVSTSGSVLNQYALASDSYPFGIAAGADGALWFVQSHVQRTDYTGSVSRITTSGAVSVYPVTGVTGPQPLDIVKSSDGNSMFFTESAQNRIGQISVVSLPTVPTNVAAPSPAKTAVLSWTGSTGASTYNVYRDGAKIGSTSATSYTDVSATNGVHSYYVVAVNTVGSSAPSGSVTVNIDTVRPVMNFTAPTSFAGQFTAGPTVTVGAADSGSGLMGMAIHVYTSANQLLTTCGSANATQLVAGSMGCSLASLPNGTYYIKAGVFDVAGNNQTINSGNFTIQSN